MFGQMNPNQQQMYQQFAQAGQGGNINQLDPHQAAQLLQHFMQNAPPDVQQRAFQEAFSQMPQEHLQMFGQQMPNQSGGGQLNPQMMAQQMQQQPDILHQFLGGGGAGGGMLSN